MENRYIRFEMHFDLNNGILNITPTQRLTRLPPMLYVSIEHSATYCYLRRLPEAHIKQRLSWPRFDTEH